MEKDKIKLLIAEYQQKVTGISFIERNYDLDDILNYVFVGLRRAGKSYLMYRQIDHLLKNGHKKEEILYFNFEDDRIIDITINDLDIIKISFEEMYNCQPIFFLDEIQNVKHWEKFARRVADQGYRTYITGSNANMLSGEIATTLGGRYMVKNIFPFSFQEYLNLKGIDMSNKNYYYQYCREIDKHFESYFRFGGLPELNQISDKREWLSNLYQKIFLGDLVMRYQVRNDFALRMLVRKLAESVKQSVSFNRLSNVISATGKKISVDTVIDYLKYLQEVWLIFSVENIVAKLAEKEANRKYYFIDNGLLGLFLIDPLTSLLENQVAIELFRRFGKEVYYYQKKVEVDFYIMEHQTAIQVSYSIKDIQTRKREVNALLEMSTHIEVKRFIIITKEEEEVIYEGDKTIEVIPIVKFLQKWNLIPYL